MKELVTDFFQLHSTHCVAMCMVGTGEGYLAGFLAGPQRSSGFEGGFIVLGPHIFRITLLVQPRDRYKWCHWENK